MWFETLEDRADFESDVAAELDVDVSVLRGFRRELESMSLGHLVRLWFGNTEQPLDTDARIVASLRRQLTTRTGLFSWIYGPGASVARDLLYVKRPSSEKRRLTHLMLRLVRSRYPWMTSRLINAMAFRPEAFTELAKGRDETDSPWGPLYSRVAIPKGRGRRHLHIPNPPLKRIQKILLRIIGPPLQERLLTCVYGTSSTSGPVFQNSAAHLGREFVATFDLCNFFGSTKVHSILSGLRFLTRSSGVMVNPTQLPNLLKNNVQAQELRWTPDAAVLVARLATHRGRLPQGSPLSPLLASVAFAPFDAEIIKNLNHLFGDRHVHYTRYFDDITISVAGAAARHRKLRTPAAVKRECEEVLVGVLSDSSYRLQPRKSRCGTTMVGQRVTGLIVGSDTVRLPRKLSPALAADCPPTRARRIG